MGVIYPSIIDSFDTKNPYRGSSIRDITTRKKFGKPLDKYTFDENYRELCQKIDEIVLALKESGFTKVTSLESKEDVISKGDDDLLFPIVINRNPVIESLKKYAQVKDHKIVFDKDAFIKDFVNIDSIAKKVKVDYNDIVQKIDYKTLTSKLNEDELLKKINSPTKIEHKAGPTKLKTVLDKTNKMLLVPLDEIIFWNQETEGTDTNIITQEYNGHLFLRDANTLNFCVTDLSHLKLSFFVDNEENYGHTKFIDFSKDEKDFINTIFYFSSDNKDKKINTETFLIKQPTKDNNGDYYMSVYVAIKFKDEESLDVFQHIFGTHEDGYDTYQNLLVTPISSSVITLATNFVYTKENI